MASPKPTSKWSSDDLFLSQASDPPSSYDVVVDVTADGDPFIAGFDLQLQNVQETIVKGPGGLHSTATVSFDSSVPISQRKLAVYFYAPMQNGVILKFTITLTALNPEGAESGDPLSWSLAWTTASDKPALLKGNVPFSAFKSGGTAVNGAGKGN